MKIQNKLKLSLILVVLMSALVWGMDNRTAYAQEPETTPSPRSDTMNNVDMMTSMMQMMTLCSNMMAMTSGSTDKQGMQGMMDGSGTTDKAPDSDATAEPNMQGMAGSFSMMDMMMQMMSNSKMMDMMMQMNRSAHPEATSEPDARSVVGGNK